MNASDEKGSARSRRGIAWFVGLLALALVLFVLWNRSRSHHANALDTMSHPVATETNVEPLDVGASAPAARTPVAITDAADSTPASAPTSSEHAVTIEVEVVDPDGRPVAGVPVSVSWPSEESTLAVMRTDEAGRATLHVEEEWVARDETIQIGTPFVGTTPRAVECTLATPPTERIRFVLEPAGSIEVGLVGGGNIEFTADDQCLLEIDDSRCGTERLAGLHERAEWIPLSSRVLVFPRVRTGLCFEAQCRVRGLRFDSVRFDGPRGAGARVRVELPFKGAQAQIRGRCIDVRGAPLPEHNLNVVTSATDLGREPTTLVEASTDETGWFRAFADRERLPKRGASVEIRAESGGARACAGRLNWPEVIDALTADQGPTIELGDIVLESLPLLATGRIVDSNGKPTWGWVEMRVISNSSLIWSSMERTYAGEDGSFQVTRSYLPEHFELRAMSYGKAPGTSIELEPGAQGVVLTLREASRINGRVLLPDGIGIDQLDFDFTCTDPPDEPHHRVSSYEWFENGLFHADDLLPGIYRVSVKLGEDELAAREAVIPKQGGIVNLEPIDLREVVHAVSVTVVAEGSDRKHEGSASIVQGEDKISEQGLTRDGNAVLIARTKVVDVVACVPGFRVQRFDGVTTGARLVLERGFPTKLCIEPVLEMPEQLCVRLDLRLQGDDALARSSNEIWVPLGADGCASTDLPANGTYRVWARLVSKSDRNGIGSSFSERLQVERSLHRGPEDIVVHLDGTALRKAIEDAQRK